MGIDWTPEVTEAARLAERELQTADNTAHQGHDGYGVDDRAASGAIAQARATIGLALEVRALRLTLADSLERLMTVVGKGFGNE